MPSDSDSPVHPHAVGAGEPPAPTGEWVFQQRGQVFGPVGGGGIGALLSSGDVAPDTPVRREGEAWRPLSSVPELRPVFEAWQARERVERDVRVARARARRATGVRWTAVGVAVGCVVALVVAAAGYLALRRPWERRNALLEGFEVSVTVGTARVARGDRATASDEIAVPGEGAPREGQRLRAPDARPGPARAGVAPRREAHAEAPAGEGGIVATNYDPARIEAVVARSKDTLAPCVREEARRSPDLTGEIPIEFAIGNDGRVTSLWILDPRFRSGPLDECLLTALRRWSFEPFSGQRPIVALSFHLAPR